MEDREWLENLKPGDPVFITQRFSEASRPDVVTGLTKTQILVGRVTKDGIDRRDRFRKSDGRLIGATTWDVQWLRQPTEELQTKYDVDRLKRRAGALQDKLGTPNTKPVLQDFIATLERLIEAQKQEQENQ